MSYVIIFNERKTSLLISKKTGAHIPQGYLTFLRKEDMVSYNGALENNVAHITQEALNCFLNFQISKFHPTHKIVLLILQRNV